MKNLLLIFSVLLGTSLYGQIVPDGTGLVNGYSIGPGAPLSGAKLSDARLIGANLINADLSGALLDSANLSGADLRYADLSFANLTGADLTGADLSGADLTGAILRDVELSGTIWSNAISQSDYDAVVAERDARPTQASYDAVVAERDAKLTLDEVKDLRAGSKMIEISNGEATISMEVEKSNELGSWTVEGNLSTTISVEPGEDKKFFRFKMDDSSSSNDDSSSSNDDSSQGGDRVPNGDGISIFDPNGQDRFEIDDDGIELSNP